MLLVPGGFFDGGGGAVLAGGAPGLGGVEHEGPQTPGRPSRMVMSEPEVSILTRPALQSSTALSISAGPPVRRGLTGRRPVRCIMKKPEIECNLAQKKNLPDPALVRVIDQILESTRSYAQGRNKETASIEFLALPRARCTTDRHWAACLVIARGAFRAV